MLYNAGEVRLDVLNERRTAGAGKKSLFRKLLSLLKSNHISTERSLDNVLEAEVLKSGNNLSELSVRELAGNGGSNDCVYSGTVFTGVLAALLKKIDSVYNIGLINDSAEGTLIYAGTALNALAVVDLCRLIVVHGDCLNLAGILAGTLTSYDSGEGTYLRTGAALSALGLVNVSNVVVVEADSAELTYVLATVCHTSTTSVSYLVSTNGTLVARYLNNLDNVGVVLVTTHSELYSLAKDRTLLVNAASGGCFLSRCNDFGDINKIFKKLIFPSKSCNLSENLILYMLYFCIKFAHNCLHLLRNN